MQNLAKQFDHGLESSMYDYADITNFNFKDGIVSAHHYQCDFFGWHPEVVYRGEAILYPQ